MKKKRWAAEGTAILMTGAMVLSMAGCGQKQQAETTAETAAETAAMAETEAAEAAGTTDFTGGTPWIDSDIKSNVTADMATSPKDDFHLYVNKDWLLSSEIPAGYTGDSSAVAVSMETEQRIQSVLTDQSLTGHDAELIQGYYEKFLDWDARNAVGIKPLQEKTDKVTAITSLDALSELLSSEEGYFYHDLILMGTTPKLEDSSLYTVGITQTALLLGDAAEYTQRTTLGDAKYSAQKDAVSKMMVRMGYTKEEAEKIFDDVVAFEGQLAEACYTSEDQMAADYYTRVNNMTTLDELKAVTDAYPLAAIMEARGYADSADFISMNPSYVEKVNELYTEDNLEHIKNLMVVYSVLGDMTSLDEEAYGIYTDMSIALTGADPAADEEIAARKVQENLLEPLEREYLEQYGSEKMKSDITGICEDIISYYRVMLESEDWLSDETKALAVNKLDNITIHSVYPEKWLDYSSLEISETSYYEAEEKIALFKHELDVSNVNQAVDKELWTDMNILECNAYYNPSDNSINIILGILSGDFYREDMTEEELYGGIGATIGHEISHAFDTSGAQFDEKGNFTNWWTEEDFTNFMDRAAKLSAYFDKIVPYTGETVRGDNVQTEAIADIAGVKAVLGILSEKEDADYDLFFRSFAKSWAANNTEMRELMILTQDVHPLDYLRTNVTVQQFDEFLQTYDVVEGDNMYLAPEDRILVW